MRFATQVPSRRRSRAAWRSGAQSPRSFGSVASGTSLQVVTTKVRGEHTILPLRCCSQHHAHPAQSFVCWQAQKLPRNRTHGLCTGNNHSLTLLSLYRAMPLLPRLPSLSRDFGRGSSRRQAEILLGTSDQVTAIGEILLKMNAP